MSSWWHIKDKEDLDWWVHPQRKVDNHAIRNYRRLQWERDIQVSPRLASCRYVCCCRLYHNWNKGLWLCAHISQEETEYEWVCRYVWVKRVSVWRVLVLWRGNWKCSGGWSREHATRESSSLVSYSRGRRCATTKEIGSRAMTLWRMSFLRSSPKIGSN